MPAAYVLVDNTVHDASAYAAYIEQIAPTVAEYGGEYLVRGGEVIYRDADWSPSRLVVIRFPDVAAAQRWIDAEELQHLHQMRRDHARSQMILIEGVT
jgi:uncharacterized protein (DUF1330 family)